MTIVVYFFVQIFYDTIYIHILFFTIVTLNINIIGNIMIITEKLKRQVWDKGIIVDQYPSDLVRKDACGAFIMYEHFGNRDSIFGWEIDHIYPATELKEKGVYTEEQIDNIINLRPLNWKNNVSKGCNYPYYTASLIADDKEATNIETSVGIDVNDSIQQELKNFYNLQE